MVHAWAGWLATIGRNGLKIGAVVYLIAKGGGVCLFQKGEWKGRKGEDGGLVLRGTAYLDFLFNGCFWWFIYLIYLIIFVMELIYLLAHIGTYRQACIIRSIGVYCLHLSLEYN